MNDDFSKPGIVYLPYEIMTGGDIEPSDEYKEFISKYNRMHKVCPVCGSKRHTSTLMGYILNLDKKDEYKDLNVCNCLDCGDTHKTHDRVPFKMNVYESD